jgi:16S rRNA processing protein RimM
MTHDDCFLLGYIVRTHGIKGELQIYLDVDYPEDYEEMDSVLIEIKGELIPYFIKHINILQQNKAIVRLEDIDTIEKAQGLVGSSLFLPDDTLDELEEGQFYYHQIKGYNVVDQSQGVLGTVITVYTPNSQDLIAMDYNGNEVLIPIVDDIVLNADHDTRTVHVNLPEGLLEIYLNPDSAKNPDDAD